MIPNALKSPDNIKSSDKVKPTCFQWTLGFLLGTLIFFVMPIVVYCMGFIMADAPLSFCRAPTWRGLWDANLALWDVMLNVTNMIPYVEAGWNRIFSVK